MRLKEIFTRDAREFFLEPSSLPLEVALISCSGMVSKILYVPMKKIGKYEVPEDMLEQADWRVLQRNPKARDFFNVTTGGRKKRKIALLQSQLQHLLLLITVPDHEPTRREAQLGSFNVRFRKDKGESTFIFQKGAVPLDVRGTLHPFDHKNPRRKMHELFTVNGECTIEIWHGQYVGILEPIKLAEPTATHSDRQIVTQLPLETHTSSPPVTTDKQLPALNEANLGDWMRRKRMQ